MTNIANSASIANKIDKEYLKGHLPKHDARAQYKRPQSIDSEITRATAEHWASIKETISQAISSKPIDSAASMAVRTTPKLTVKEASRLVGRPRKSDNSSGGGGGKNKGFYRAIPDHVGKRNAEGEEYDDSEITPSQKRTRRPRATKDRAIDAIKDTIESMRTPFSDMDSSTNDIATNSAPASPPSAAASETQ
jgi:hypothetical protein